MDGYMRADGGLRDAEPLVSVILLAYNHRHYIRQAIESGAEDIPAKVICTNGTVHDLLLHVRGLTADEKEILLDGCLMNYYAKRG